MEGEGHIFCNDFSAPQRRRGAVRRGGGEEDWAEFMLCGLAGSGVRRGLGIYLLLVSA